MRDLTLHELDTQVAEQLPARELMGGCWHRSGSTTNGSYNQNSAGLINVLNGNNIQVLSFGQNGNGNVA